jgi:endonuclease/exonuclease/phosphatase family metal-dependent hydrolase
VAAVAVTVATVMVLTPGRALAQRADLRVMSFNIRVDVDRGPNRWELRRDKVVTVIDDFNPDILGMQEDRKEQDEYILSQLPRYTKFGRSTKPDGSGEHNAILYRTNRFTELRSGTFWLSETPDVPGSRGWKARIPRAVNWVELADNNNPGLVFAAMNTHWENGPKGASARLHSATLMREKMAEIAGDVPVVFTGDFNADEGTPPYQRMTGRDDNDGRRFLIDTYRNRHPQDSDRVGTAHRFTGKAGRGRIDWILHDEGFETLDAGIVRTSFDGRYPSDHFPITGTLEPTGLGVGAAGKNEIELAGNLLAELRSARSNGHMVSRPSIESSSVLPVIAPMSIFTPATAIPCLVSQ